MKNEVKIVKRYLITGLIFLIAVSGCSAKHNTTSQNKPMLPKKLASLDISNVIKGAEAVKMIRKMHGDNILVFKQAFIGRYTSNGSQSTSAGATVWLSIVETKQSNQRLLKLMTNKINQGNTPFSKPDKKQVDGQVVYRLSGMGQSHYYFAIDKKLIWLAVDTANEKRAIKDLIQFLR